MKIHAPRTTWTSIPTRYLIISFFCIFFTETNLHSLCKTDNQVLSVNPETHGFIVSPIFPQPYARKATGRNLCTINMATALGMGIHIESVYMDLQIKTRDNCHNDYIEFTWTDHTGSHDLHHCGRDHLDVKITSSNVVLMFV